MVDMQNAVETKEDVDLKKLDPTKVEALRQQLRMALSNGQVTNLADADLAVPHSSHGDSDGWI